MESFNILSHFNSQPLVLQPSMVDQPTVGFAPTSLEVGDTDLRIQNCNSKFDKEEFDSGARKAFKYFFKDVEGLKDYDIV